MDWPKLNDSLLEVAEVQCEQMVDENREWKWKFCRIS